MFPGEHHIDEDAHGVDVRADIRLRQPILLRGSKAGSPQNLGVALVFRLVEPGGIKIDEDRLRSPQDDILRLHIPMNSADGVEHPQCPTHLYGNLAGLFRGKERILQQKSQGIPLNKFLQHQVFPVFLCHLVYGGQIWAGIVQKFPVNFRISGKVVQNKFLSCGLMLDQAYAAPGTLLHYPDLLILFL